MPAGSGSSIWCRSTDPALVLPAIAQVLDVGASGERPLRDTLIGVLQAEPLLLLLDNFEQVLAAAPDVAALLAACPLLTRAGHQPRAAAPVRRAYLRRAAAGAAGRHAGATLAAVAQSEAGALFIARAQAAQRDVAITEATAPAIAAICARLDGLPLAIELAAARSTLLPPAALLARLEQRLDLLTGGARDAPARQQTLRATIDWSYQLLTPAQQRLFARLSVFVGGWTLEAAEAICAAPDDAALRPCWTGCRRWSSSSWCGTTPRPAARRAIGCWRRCASTPRERFAADAEREAVERRYVAYYLALAERADDGMRGPEQVAWLDRLEPEQGNLRAAFEWALARGEAELCLRLAAAQHLFWLRRGQLREGRRHAGGRAGAAGRGARTGCARRRCWRRRAGTRWTAR